MSDKSTTTKKVTGTTAAIAGVLTVTGAIFGGGMKVSEYQAQVEAARAEASRMLAEAKDERDAAIAACEATAEEAMQKQQERINLLLQRFEALARDRQSRPDPGQYQHFSNPPNMFRKGGK